MATAPGSSTEDTVSNSVQWLTSESTGFLKPHILSIPWGT